MLRSGSGSEATHRSSNWARWFRWWVLARHPRKGFSVLVGSLGSWSIAASSWSAGLARGIDTVAHETAMEHGGRTVAVLATPLDQAAPPGNAALQERIIRQHVAVTQFPPGTPVQKMNFTIRNRTMALLSVATIIVEAGPNSGTRHQGREAIRLGRSLFFLESALTSSARWIQELMDYGAEVLNDENLANVLREMPTRVASAGIPF